MKLKTQKITWDDAGNVMTIAYQKIGEEVVFDRRMAQPEIRDHAEMHGFEQRFGDLDSGDKTGVEKFQSATALREQYYTSNDWMRQAERDTLTELFQAVAVVCGETLEDVKKSYEADQDQLQDWRDDNKVKLELANMRVAKRAAVVAADPKAGKLVIKGLK